MRLVVCHGRYVSGCTNIPWLTQSVCRRDRPLQTEGASAIFHQNKLLSKHFIPPPYHSLVTSIHRTSTCRRSTSRCGRECPNVRQLSFGLRSSLFNLVAFIFICLIPFPSPCTLHSCCFRPPLPSLLCLTPLTMIAISHPSRHWCHMLLLLLVLHIVPLSSSTLPLLQYFGVFSPLASRLPSPASCCHYYSFALLPPLFFHLHYH